MFFEPSPHDPHGLLTCSLEMIYEVVYIFTLWIDITLSYSGIKNTCHLTLSTLFIILGLEGHTSIENIEESHAMTFQQLIASFVMLAFTSLREWRSWYLLCLSKNLYKYIYSKQISRRRQFNTSYFRRVC